jgi:hypothetical protein
VAGGNGAPTEAQLNAVNELEAIYAIESKAHNAFVTKTLAGWSEELRKLGLLGLTAVKALP